MTRATSSLRIQLEFLFFCAELRRHLIAVISILACMSIAFARISGWPLFCRGEIQPIAAFPSLIFSPSPSLQRRQLFFHTVAAGRTPFFFFFFFFFFFVLASSILHADISLIESPFACFRAMLLLTHVSRTQPSHYAVLTAPLPDLMLYEPSAVSLDAEISADASPPGYRLRIHADDFPSPVYFPPCRIFRVCRRLPIFCPSPQMPFLLFCAPCLLCIFLPTAAERQSHIAVC